VSFVLLISTVCKRQFVSERYSAAVHVTAVVLLSGGRYGSLTGRVESTGAAILFGDLSDEGMECDDNYLGQRDGNSQCAEDATADHYCCIEMDAADICFRWRGQEEWGVREKARHIFDVDGKIFCQNYPGLLAEQGKLLRFSMHETVSLQIKLFNTNQYILIVQLTFSHDIDAKLTDKTEIKLSSAFWGLLGRFGVPSRVCKNCGVLT